MHTEQEARKLWCPMVRYGGENEASNRWSEPFERGGHYKPDLNPDICRCIASQCAMWRWEEGETGKVTRGYCGLGGAP